MEYIYPNEPHANSKSTIKLKKGGTYFGYEKVLRKEKLPNGALVFTTSYEEKDNNKDAKMYKTYTFSGTDYSVTKEVQYIGSEERFIRNKYTHKRIKK